MPVEVAVTNNLHTDHLRQTPTDLRHIARRLQAPADLRHIVRLLQAPADRPAPTTVRIRRQCIRPRQVSQKATHL